MSEAPATLDLAPFWKRGAAYAIDGIVFVVPYFILLLCLLALYSFINGMGMQGILQYVFAPKSHVLPVITFITQNVWIAVLAWFLARCRWQATPGKRIMGIHVVNPTGGRLGYKQAFLRMMLPFYIFFGCNLLSTNTLDDYSAKLDQAYKEALFVHFPDMVDDLERREMSLQEYLFDPEGQQKYASAFNSLTPDEQQILLRNMKELTEAVTKPKILTTPFILFLLTMAVWYLSALFTKEKTTIHDIVAKTRVINGKVN